MRGPDLEFRREVARRAGELDNEDALAGLLEEIEGRISEDIGRGELNEDPEESLAVLESWASVTSDALVRFYGPESPLRRSFSGWSPLVAWRITKISQLLRRPLGKLAAVLRAGEYSVSVGFPWPSITISVGWAV